MRHVVLFLFFSLALSAPPFAAKATGDDVVADLQRILAEFHAENPAAPGVTISVVCPALGVDWAGAVGQVARDAREALTPAHTFRIASNSKTYVAAAILRLAEEGQLDLDAPLARYLPAKLASLLVADGYDLAAITLRHVLTHTAGLADHTDDDSYGEAIFADPQHVWTREEQVRRCVERFDPLGEPGERYVYSDTGYVLLGGIIERATGRALGPAVRQLLDYERLDLRATWWEYQEEAPPLAGPRAHQYIGQHDTVDWHASFDLYGGGGLVCDVHDLGAFLRALLAGRVLRQPASLAAMTGDGTPEYRLGLMVADIAGHLAWGHTGFWNTFAFHVPALDATVSGAVLSRDAARGRVLAERIIARLDRAVSGD